MKKNKNHLQDWEMLEKKWQEQVNAYEEQLPDGLWEKLEGRKKREEGRGKKGEVQSVKSVVLIRWSAAAAVLLFLFFWVSFERGGIEEWASGQSGQSVGLKESEEVRGKREQVSENGTVPELVEGRSLSLSNGEHVKKNFQSKKDRILINSAPSIESIAQVSVKNEMPVKSIPSIESVESMKLVESVKSVESVKPVVQTEVDEMVVVVDVVAMESTKKVNAINKVIGFIKKVKTGKILDLTTKNREGKLNDGIHRVMYQYEETEEKLKNTLSL